MNAAPEQQIIARCQRGEAAAWNELFDAHYAAAARFIFQLSPAFTREDAEEICQETFLSVIKNIGSFGGNSRLQTWIFRIASNKAADYAAKSRAAKRGGGATAVPLDATAPGGRQLELPDTARSPDAAVAASDDALRVMSALDQLEEPCRQIIQLRYFGDLSYDEIAAEMVLHPKTASSRLSRCLDRLTEIAAAHFPGGKPKSSSV